MAPIILYFATVLGLIGLYLVLRPGPRAQRVSGAMLGLATLAWMLATATEALADDGEAFGVFSWVFSLIAIAAAGRMISHPRPVFAALYFVLVVISSAGLFLMLDAEFMTFALIIVYAGAILITYLFVLMLAHQATTPEHEEETEDYDRLPREPGAAVFVGFILLALFASTLFAPGRLPAPPEPDVRAEAGWRQLERMPIQFEDSVTDAIADFDWPPARQPDGHFIVIDAATGAGRIEGHLVGQTQQQWFDLPDDARPDNVQQVGWALVYDFPASLELAGIILLMAMFGAVVLARRQIDLTEDEKREAAGLRRLATDADGSVPGGGA